MSTGLDWIQSGLRRSCRCGAKRGLMTSPSLSAPARRLTKVERDSFVLPTELVEIVVGSALGELNIQNRYTNYSRLRFKQSTLNIDYIEHLHQLFSPYCGMQTPKQ